MTPISFKHADRIHPNTDSVDKNHANNALYQVEEDAKASHNSVESKENHSYLNTPENAERFTPMLNGTTQTAPAASNSTVLINRLIGASQAAFGAGETAFGFFVGVTTAETAVGPVLGGALIERGFDNISAGVRTAVSGQRQQTQFNSIMRNVGLSENTAELVEMLADVGMSNESILIRASQLRLFNVERSIINNSATVGEINSTTFKLNITSRALSNNVALFTDDLVNAMRNKGRSIDIAFKGSDDYRYLESIGADGSTNTEFPEHILIKENASKSALIEEFLHGTQIKLGIVDRIKIQGAEIHVKDFMIRHASLLGLNNSADLRLLEQLKIEEIERLTITQKVGLK